jgi:hypothetical protein
LDDKLSREELEAMRSEVLAGQQMSFMMSYRQALEHARQHFGDDAMLRAFVDCVEGNIVDYLVALPDEGSQGVTISPMDITREGETARVWVLRGVFVGETFAWVFAVKDYELLR